MNRLVMALVAASVPGAASNVDAGEDYWLRDRSHKREVCLGPDTKQGKRAEPFWWNPPGKKTVPHEPDKPANPLEWKPPQGGKGPASPPRPANKFCPVCHTAPDASLVVTWDKQRVSFHDNKCRAEWEQFSDVQKAKALKSAEERAKRFRCFCCDK